MSSSTPLTPTYYGHISSTLDSLILFESCLNGTMNHVPRRPHDRERSDLIQSGNVFIYEEHSSGIKRWTDGINWSPSRILGNFLIYRELERPFAPGEKKRANKRNKKTNGVAKSQQESRSGSTSSVMGPNGPSAAASQMDAGSSGLDKDYERSLVGSLVDSYPFKKNGLVKKTISVQYQGVPHHLVSYYSIADVTSGRLKTPMSMPNLSAIIPRTDLISGQNFRAPIDEVEYSADDHSAGFIAAAHPFAHGIPPQLNALRGLHLPGAMQLPPPSPYSVPPPPVPSFGPPISSHMHAVGYAPQQMGQHYQFDSRTRFASTAGIPDVSGPFMSTPRRHSTAYEAASGADFHLAAAAALSSTMNPPAHHHHHHHHHPGVMGSGENNSDFLSYEGPMRAMGLSEQQDNGFLTPGPNHIDQATLSRNQSLADLGNPGGWAVEDPYMGNDAPQSHDNNEHNHEDEEGNDLNGDGHTLNHLQPWMGEMNSRMK
jgi:Gti1/Pac2 family transcription factor